MKNLLIRTASALVFAIIVIGSIYLGKNWTFVAMGIFLCISLFEIKHFVSFKKYMIIPYIIIGAIFYFIGTYGTPSYSYRQWSAIIVLFFISFLIMMLSHSKMKESPWIFKISALFYITVPFILFMTLFQFSEIIEQKAYFFPLCLFATIWTGDSFAYFTGSLWGKHKMAPKISPHKSWEGFVGGFISVLLLGWLIWHITDIQIKENTLIFWMLFCSTIYIFGTFGDFYESFFKRKVDIKDSGNIMPGHGGAFDRFDSFIFSVPCIILYLLTCLT